ncbi:DUF4293 family protein [Rhodothermus marinus]|uniref:DUF4293 family protein n=1 Tax=Rhodothermus marinus TaxID=29549 RepID=UPI0012BA55E3|nr:DUF4293 family protein [Rhodothermus marinus]BBM73024.1 hypothetical protein RmaAA338_18890 [Rhodothermus marinus]
MIQRIQSVYLLLAGLVLFWLGLAPEPWHLLTTAPYAWIGTVARGLAVLLAIGAVVIIFQYRRLERQRTLVVFEQVGVLLMAAAYLGGLYLSGTLNVRSESGILWDRVLWIGLPVLAYLLLWLARRGIERDIALIRSMDRLR